jgi:hypothetical protein
MGEIVPMRAPALKQMWGKRGGNDKSDGSSNKSISLGIRAVRARMVRPSARGGAPAPRRGAGTEVILALGAVAWGNRLMQPTRPGTRAVRARMVRPSARGGAPAPRRGAGTEVTKASVWAFGQFGRA